MSPHTNKYNHTIFGINDQRIPRDAHECYVSLAHRAVLFYRNASADGVAVQFCASHPNRLSRGMKEEH